MITQDFAVHEAEPMEGSAWDQHRCRKLVDSYRKGRDLVETVVEDQGFQDGEEFFRE